MYACGASEGVSVCGWGFLLVWDLRGSSDDTGGGDDFSYTVFHGFSDEFCGHNDYRSEVTAVFGDDADFLEFRAVFLVVHDGCIELHAELI